MSELEQVKEKVALSLCSGMLIGEELYEDDGYLFMTDEYRKKRVEQIFPIITGYWQGRIDTLEKQLFRNEPVKDEICHLTWNMWQTLKSEFLEEGEKG